jgi:hypothetical protein
MTKKALWRCLTFLVFVTGTVSGAVNIPTSCCIKNQPPGRCGWCSLETLGRYHHLQALYRISEKNATRCTTRDLETTLVRLGIMYRVQQVGESSQDILRYAIQQRLGAIVGLREPQPGAGAHAVTLVDFTNIDVRVIDSNDQDGRIRTMTRAQFHLWWNGFTLVLEPKEPLPDDVLRERYPSLPVLHSGPVTTKSSSMVIEEKFYYLVPAEPQR